MRGLLFACVSVLPFVVGCRAYNRNIPRDRPIEVSVSASYQYEDGCVSVTVRK